MLTIRAWKKDDCTSTSTLTLQTIPDDAASETGQQLTQRRPDLSSENTPGSECLICLHDFEEGELVAESLNQACHHTFQEACLKTWLIRSPCRPPVAQIIVCGVTMKRCNIPLIYRGSVWIVAHPTKTEPDQVSGMAKLERSSF